MVAIIREKINKEKEDYYILFKNNLKIESNI